MVKRVEIFGGDIRYAFASGRIRALEQKLITKVIATKLVEAELEDFPRILADYGYSFPGEFKSEQALDKAFNDEIHALLAFLEFLSVDKTFPILFRKRFDFLNLASILKSKLTATEFASLPFGTFQPSEMKYLFENEIWNKFPQEIYDALLHAKKIYDETSSLWSIDTIIEWHYYNFLKTKIKKNRFIAGYYDLYFDLQNIINLARFRVSEKPFKSFLVVYIEGGMFGIDFLRALYEFPPEQALSRLAESEFGRQLGEGFYAALQSNEFSDIEYLKEKILHDYLEQTRYCPFGLELLFSYYKRKEKEIGVVRKIALSKFLGIPPDEIKQNLPYPYG